MGHFVLLGAGFSRALSEHMPLLPQLGDLVLHELEADEFTLAPFGDNLEQWLSYLSTDQPWLSDSDNMRNRATFVDASHAVEAVISGSERRALSSPPPEWALRLVTQWCLNESHVMTFNYDVLVERVAQRLHLVKTWADLYAMPVTERTLPGSGAMLGYEDPIWSLFTLYKLHGSTNWMYGGLDAPVTEQAVITNLGGGWQPDEAPRSRRRKALYSDLAPLIVPPTGTKGPYYGNRSLRAQWQRAFEELEFATSVTVIGYSFPPSDLVTRHFFASANLGCPVTVVDFREQAGEPIRELAPRAEVTVVYGPTAVADYVDQTCGDMVRWGAVRTGAGYAPRLTVNGQDVLPEDPMVLDEQTARLRVGREVDERWPDLRRDAPLHELDQEGNAWLRSYTGTAPE